MAAIHKTCARLASKTFTYRVTYEKPYAPALLSWGLWILPRHLLESAWKAGVDLRTTRQNRFPVGSGPYRFGEWKTGEKVVLETNPEYFEGRPYLKRVVYRIIPDQSTIFLELKARNIDLASLTPIQYRRKTEYPALLKLFHRYRYVSNSYAYLGFNLRDARFQDKRVRQAIAHAINKQEIIEGVLLGGSPGGGSLQAGHVVVQGGCEDVSLRSRAGPSALGRGWLEARERRQHRAEGGRRPVRMPLCWQS